MVFLAHAVESPKMTTSLSNVEMVREYEDVFSDELLGLPPSRQVEFQIDLVLGTDPIAKAPYPLDPLEMKDLMSQLQELLERGFI